LTRLAFGICFRDRRLRVEVTREEARYSLLEGPPLEIAHHGQTITVANPESVSGPIPEVIESEAPTQPARRSPTPRGIPG
jgi:alpha,alpha-trehalose phosphorylase